MSFGLVNVTPNASDGSDQVVGTGVLFAPNLDSSPTTQKGQPPAGPTPSTAVALGSPDTATAIAMKAADAATGYAAQLIGIAASALPPVISPVFPTNTNAPAITAPEPPTLQPIVYVPPPLPAPFTQTLSVDGQFPAFFGEAPQLVFPAAPMQPQLIAPASPAVDTNFTYPDVEVSLPAAPELLSFNVVPFDGVTFPRLSATAPTFSLIAPQVVNYVAGSPYTDTLLMALQGTLQSRLLGGTGLSPAVEANIWNREREREYRQQADAIAQLDRMETMGYALPSGAFIDARIKIETETNYAIASQSRDVAIKQADLEQNNIKMALEQSVAIESRLIDYANQREQRNFDAVKYVTEAGVTLYNAQVMAFGQRIDIYKSAIQAYTAQLEAAKTEVQIYTAQLDAEKTKADINQSIVAEYKVRVDAALSSIQVFEGQISVLKTRAEIEQLKVSIYGEQIKGYAAEANVYATNVEAYKATISAEGTKEQTYATQTQAYGTLVDATSKQISAQIEVFKAQIAAKTEQYDAFKAQVESQAEAVKAVAAQNNAVADIYRAEVQGTSSYNEAMIKEWQAFLQLQESITQVGVSAAQANGQLYISARTLASDATKVAAQVEAQIAASALGAVTFATHNSHQDSVSYGVSRSYGESYSTGSSTSHSTSESASTSTSFSTSVGTSASVGTNTSKAE